MRTFVVDVMHCKTVELKAEKLVAGAEVVTPIDKDSQIVAAFPTHALLRIFEKATASAASA